MINIVVSILAGLVLLRGVLQNYSRHWTIVREICRLAEHV